MTIPNLIGILTLSKEMKREVALFFDEYLQKFPGRKRDQLKMR
jgi:AGCS family alanine or glycine:cation symporter